MWWYPKSYTWDCTDWIAIEKRKAIHRAGNSCHGPSKKRGKGNKFKRNFGR